MDEDPYKETVTISISDSFERLKNYSLPKLRQFRDEASHLARIVWKFGLPEIRKPSGRIRKKVSWKEIYRPSEDLIREMAIRNYKPPIRRFCDNNLDDMGERRYLVDRVIDVD